MSLSNCYAINLEESNGTIVNETTRDDIKENATVSANSLNNWAVIPWTNTIGKNTATVVRVDAVTAKATSFAPVTAAVIGCSPHDGAQIYFREQLWNYPPTFPHLKLNHQGLTCLSKFIKVYQHKVAMIDIE